MQYSDEQLEYINFLEKEDTKLIACAGSGKTRCIIARLENLLENKIYSPNETLMVTFSRPTQNDFIVKMQKYGATHISPDSVRTIDSFAKKIIDPNNDVDVSTLSYTFLMFMEQTKVKDLRKHPLLANIKCIFVDEAQDLNHTQYKIVSLMKKKLKCVINLVGDPNQNIFQWRGSTDKYIVKWKAKVFYLTKNYRSMRHIVDFSTHIRPYNNITVSHHHQSKKSVQPIFFGHQNDETFEKTLIEIINMLQANKKCDLADIAILSPTRGYLRSRKRLKSKGLCFVSNILAKHGIPFAQFYEESTEMDTTRGKYQRVPGHLNLLTYTGSKGLEWDHVIMTDAESGLINKMYFTEEKHKHDQYLLYVACTRAIQNLFVFAPYTRSENMRNFNPWFDVVPKALYKIPDHRYFKYGSLKFSDRNDADNKITRIIQKMTEVDLYQLAQKLQIADVQEYSLYPNDYRSVGTTNSIFLGKLTELVFKYQYNVHFGRKPCRLPLIDYVVKKSNVIVCNSYYFWKWYNGEGEKTWAEYDKIKDTLNVIARSFVDKLDRKTPLEDYHFTNDDFYAEMVLKHSTEIKKLYNKYLEGTTWNSESLEVMFMLMVVMHAIDTNHYFHLHNKGQKFRDVMTNFRDMFDDMWSFVHTINQDMFRYFNVPVLEYQMEGEVDILDKFDNIHEIKCIQSINLTHKLQVLIYNIMWHKMQDTPVSNYQLSFYNFLEGKRYIYKIESTKEEIEYIVKSFQKIGNTKEYVEPNWD